MPRKKSSDQHTFSIQLGEQPGSADVDAFTLVLSKMLICANSGGGKSYLLRRFAEQVADKIPTFIIDPEGEYSTLREKIDVVLVGPKGDVPASVATATLLARRLVELRVSAVVDLHELSLPDKQKFVKLFVDALLNLPRDLWTRKFVILDEVHKFCPETERDVVSRDSVIALMDQGRKRRLGAVLATQRLSKLAASARAEANNVFVGRTAQDLDLRRAADLLGFNKSDWKTIKEFEPGEFYAYGPAFSKRGILKFRSGRVQTTHSLDDQSRVVAPRPSTTILRQRIAQELGDLQQEVDKEKDEMTRLREENQRLRARSSVPVPTSLATSRKELAEAERTGWTRGREEGSREGFSKGWEAARRTILNVADSLVAAATDFPKKVRALSVELPKAPPAPPKKESTSVEQRAPKPRPALSDANGTSEDLGRGAPFKLITVLVQHGKAMSRSKAAFLAGISPTTGTFRNALSKLRLEGLMEDAGNGTIIATKGAQARFGGTVAPLPAGTDLLDYWRDKFGDGAPGKLFTVLVDAGGPLSRDEAADRAGILPTTGTFRNALSTLRTAGVLQDHQNKQIAISEELIT